MAMISNQTKIDDPTSLDNQTPTGNKTLALEDVNDLDAEELAEQFKAGDLELCVEPLSEWGSDLETLFQKLEKGIMQWHEIGVKRSLTICFTEEDAPVVAREAPAKEKVIEGNPPLTAPATLA
jgi:hypothetical protein